ncbi:MAG TPA: LemA family protein [Thermodesulfovibrionales bacterium]|jgi:LemA protein|nr:LemA family protein [Thermodesulfovibrionales bacterium]
MEGTAALFGIFTGFTVLLAALSIAIYNKMAFLRNAAKSSWIDLNVLLQVRYDLVPDLGEVVKSHAPHEMAAIENLSKARSAAMKASSPAEKGTTEKIFAETLKTLFSLAEAYPELAAYTGFLRIRRQWEETGKKIEKAGRVYNAIVRDLNAIIESFPSSMIATLFRFHKAESFGPETQAIKAEPR